MSGLNIPAIASTAFLGFLALAALLFCIPPVTRFLGDLCCCPWRVPFTRKRRRNEDEEVEDEDLPYLAKPRSSTPSNDTGYQSESHMTAARTPDESYQNEAGDWPTRMDYADERQGFDEGSYDESYENPEHQWPHSDTSHNRDWWRSPTDEYPEYSEYPEYPEYPSQATYSNHSTPYYSDDEFYGYDKETSPGHDIQLPQPSYSPQESGSSQYTGGYFPGVEQDHYSQYRRI